MEPLALDGVARNFEGVKHTYHEDNSSGHGRVEERICTAIEIPEVHPQRQRWPDLRTLVVVEKHRRTTNDSNTREWRFYISSLPPKADILADAVRWHWTTESRQHWNPDVSFGEDTKRARDKNVPTILAALSRLTLSLL